ncbi:hypothetical protein [Antarcticirhabdus aurantiaca]|uniref:Uncharacterized protein n=1 Tax=Antarcticirhabdus aurantiaca TaxID=2606717 RepID=A0ACD4NQ97_9HYPH|nr:hypothetical protein [Antarcticirhabdus aurantiaca]WAJ28921.1 hypothetical protein OXU80_01310 [Jeongeuplla avenae]
MTTAGRTLAEALALTSDDMERMSTPDLLQLLELLLGLMPLSALERIERRVFSCRDRKA